MRTAIGMVLALAVGIGVGYLLGASKDRDAPARAAPPAAPPREMPAEIRPAGDSPLARALRELPVPEVPRGTGTISGRVTTRDGTPVAGVAVRATLAASVGKLDGDIEEELKRLAADLLRRRASAVEAVTAADGTYALSGLADAPYDVRARLAGFRVEPARGGGNRIRPDTTLDFLATEVAEVTFDVRMPDGSVAPDATISLSAEGRIMSAHAWRADDPRLLLPNGSFMCVAEYAGGDYASEKMPLDIHDGAPVPPTVLLRLKGRAGIRGTIFFSKDLPFTDASVCALAFSGDTPPDPKQLRSRDWSEQAQDWTTAQQGFRYALLDLPPARYVVVVFAEMAPVATKVVDVGTGVVPCDFTIDTIDPSLYVLVRVLDPAGKPVRDVSFGTGYRTNHGSSSSSGNHFPMRADGSYLVMHHEHTREEGGTYFIEAESERYGKRRVEYKREETKEIVIRFGDAATVDLTIEGYAPGEAGETISVVLVPVTEDEEEHDDFDAGTSADAEGKLTLGPVEAGDYEIRLLAGPGERWERLLAASRRVTLSGGKNAVRMPMPRLFTLVVIDPEHDAGSVCLNAASNTVRATADGKDRAIFRAVPEGTYQIGRTSDFGHAMRVTLPGPSEVTFRPQPLNAFRVVLVRAGETWSKAGFLDGDLIVAVEGDELESAEELQLAQATLWAKEKVSLTVLRGGTRVPLEVNPKELLSADDGRLEWSLR